jgi:hypothetical protein
MDADKQQQQSRRNGRTMFAIALTFAWSSGRCSSVAPALLPFLSSGILPVTLSFRIEVFSFGCEYIAHLVPLPCAILLDLSRSCGHVRAGSATFVR